MVKNTHIKNLLKYAKWIKMYLNVNLLDDDGESRGMTLK